MGKIVRAAASGAGDLLATFMAKPFNDEGGSGFHVHVSVNDESGRNVFGDPGGPDGLSAVGRHAIGGCSPTRRR
jgi:glutamine synthetase